MMLEKYGKIEDLDKSFDYQYWKTRTDTERFATAWELVEQAWTLKGRDVRQLELQRSVEHFQRKQR